MRYENDLLLSERASVPFAAAVPARKSNRVEMDVGGQTDSKWAETEESFAGLIATGGRSENSDLVSDSA
jgi:hypothetical protein